MPGSGVDVNVKFKARKPVVPPLASGVALKACGTVGFLKAFSKAVASETAGDVDAEAVDSDGLGRCVLGAILSKAERLVTPVVDESGTILLSLEVGTPSFFSAALMFKRTAVALIIGIHIVGTR